MSDPVLYKDDASRLIGGSHSRLEWQRIILSTP